MDRDPSILVVEDLGCVPYAEALALQRRAVAERCRGERPDTLFLLEHPSVITLGRSADEANLRRPRAELMASGIDVHEVGRGGDVTWHGPGQLVGYPIIDLAERGMRDVHRYLRTLEATLSRVLEGFGLEPELREGFTGVFVKGPPGDVPRKIASIGVGVRRWVTFHGFALNVETELASFDDIVPCGLHDVRMTSIASELGERAPLDLGKRCRAEVVRAFLRSFPGALSAGDPAL